MPESNAARDEWEQARDVIDLTDEEEREITVIEQTAYALFTSSLFTAPAKGAVRRTWNQQSADTREKWREWARGLIEELDNCGLTITDKDG